MKTKEQERPDAWVIALGELNKIINKNHINLDDLKEILSKYMEGKE